jgi:hypothetical protein
MLISFETRTLAPNLEIPYIEKGEMAETPVNFQSNPCTPNVGEDLIPSSLHPEPQIEPKLVAEIRTSYLQYIGDIRLDFGLPSKVPFNPYRLPLPLQQSAILDAEIVEKLKRQAEEISNSTNQLKGDNIIFADIAKNPSLLEDISLSLTQDKKDQDEISIIATLFFCSALKISQHLHSESDVFKTFSLQNRKHILTVSS